MNSQFLNKLIYLLIPLFCFADLFGLETIVQGKIDGFDKKIIQVGYYEDYITYSEKWLSMDSIENGKFRLSFQIPTTRHILLKVEDKTTTLFAEEGQVYNIILEYDQEVNNGRIHDKTLNLSFPFPKGEDINFRIKKFNDSYGDFIKENQDLFKSKNAGNKIEEYIKSWESSLSNEKEYVSSYIRYSLVGLEIINRSPREKLKKDYFIDQAIQYLQKEYMNLFIQLYSKDFELLTYTKKGTEILKAIMIEKSLKKTKKLISEIKGFHDPAFAELYLIYGLFETYYKKTVNQKESLNLLKQIANLGENENNQLIANNVINLLQSNDNQIAPPFKLENTDNKDIHLSSFRGKIVYLNFWANWSIPSIRELKVIQKLHEKYRNKIEFISINIDEDKTFYNGKKK